MATKATTSPRQVCKTKRSSLDSTLLPFSSPQIWVFAFLALFITTSVRAQGATSDKLFNELRIQDSLLFELGVNQCDLVYLEEHIADDLAFYHDQNGLQDKTLFLDNIRRFVCSGSGNKPIRKVNYGELSAFPLFDNGHLYGAIQSGTHYFYLRDGLNTEWLTNTARFTHVWVLQDGTWVLDKVLSYDHREPTN